ncbi:MAG: GAF domain-containing protein [Pseudomonadota bacterium]
MPEATLTATQLARLEAASPLLPAIDAVGREAMGHALCTAMRFEAATMRVRRLYTSNAEAYPLGGWKAKRDTAWGRHVLLEGRVFVGEGAAAIEAHFDDHALIARLGLRSIVNVPVRLGGACVGTLNFLWEAERLGLAHVATTRLLALLAAPDWA